MNIFNLVGQAYKLASKPEHRALLSSAISKFKSGGFQGKPDDVYKAFDEISKELGMSRDHIIKELLPYLDNSWIARKVNEFVPGSVSHFRNILNDVGTNTSAQSNGNNAGNSGIARSYPKKFNF